MECSCSYREFFSILQNIISVTPYAEVHRTYLLKKADHEPAKASLDTGIPMSVIKVFHITTEESFTLFGVTVGPSLALDSLCTHKATLGGSIVHKCWCMLKS